MDVELDDTNLNDLRQSGDPFIGSIGRAVRLAYAPDAKRNNWAAYRLMFDVAGKQIVVNSDRVFARQSVPRPFRAFYSEAAVGFAPPPLNSVTATDIDQQVFARRSGVDLAQQIAQLLIDIRAADNEDLSVWIRNNEGKLVPPELRDVRMRRFTDAIEFLMPHKRFDTIVRINNEYRINFTEFGKSTTLQQLSTGEKQIIFRGGFILRDLASVWGGVVLVDEPELSLHPDWQKRILGFYQRLLPQSRDRTTQLIVATHSPFIVHEQVSAKVIVLRKSATTGRTEIEAAPIYPGAAQAMVVQALNVQSLLHNIERDVVLLVEGRTDRKILEEAWGKLNPSKPMPFEIRALLGDRNIQLTLSDDQVFKANPGIKLIGLFDFDAAYNHWLGVWKGNSEILECDVKRGLLKKKTSEVGWAMLLPVPSFREELASERLGGASALCIELLFEDKYHLVGMIEAEPLPAVGAHKPVVRKNMKGAFADHVATLPAAAFAAFTPIFEHLDTIGRVARAEPSASL